VVVDALEIFGLYAVPRDVGMGITFKGDRPNQVFDKYGAVISLFGDMLFIRPLEEGVDFRAATGFDEGNQILDPDRFAEGDFKPDVAALVVGTAGADGLATRAKSGDGNGHSHLEGEIVSMENGVKAGLVIDQAGGAADGGLLFNEVGEVEFEVGRLGMELVLQGAENLGDALDMNQATVILKDFQKAAHMGAFELMGQVDGEGNGGHRVLSGAGAVADDNGIMQALDPHLVDPEVTEVRGGLGIVELSLPRAGFSHAKGSISRERGAGKGVMAIKIRVRIR
jgi:hypothetical protein